MNARCARFFQTGNLSIYDGEKCHQLGMHSWKMNDSLVIPERIEIDILKIQKSFRMLQGSIYGVYEQL